MVLKRNAATGTFWKGLFIYIITLPATLFFDHTAFLIFLSMWTAFFSREESAVEVETIF